MWGWRSENIPMDQVKWVHQAEDLETPPQPPLIRWPGSVIGFRRFLRGPAVEFMASRDKGLVIIAAGEGYYAISPFQANDFVQTYNTLTELGSLSLLPTQSSRPALLFSEVSAKKPILWIFLAGAVLKYHPLGLDPVGYPFPGKNIPRFQTGRNTTRTPGKCAPDPISNHQYHSLFGQSCLGFISIPE